MALIRRMARAAQAAREHTTGQRVSNRAELSSDEILRRAVELQVCYWTYKYEPASVSRLGPMAQDFHDAFGLGTTDRTVPLESAVGVLLVCIQELYRELEELRPARGSLAADASAVPTTTAARTTRPGPPPPQASRRETRPQARNSGAESRART